MLTFLVWMYALCLSLPPFFNWGKYGLEPGNISCSVSWRQRDPETHNSTYIGFLFIFGFLIPVVIISSSYCSIVCTLRNISRRVRECSISARLSSKSTPPLVRRGCDRSRSSSVRPTNFGSFRIVSTALDRSRKLCCHLHPLPTLTDRNHRVKAPKIVYSSQVRTIRGR